jgi:hypothetical protein
MYSNFPSPLKRRVKDGIASLWSTVSLRCRVDVSPTENSWMLRPLNKAFLRYWAPDRCVSTLHHVQHGTSSVGRYGGLGWPPAPNGSVGRLAGFAYPPDQVYWVGRWRPSVGCTLGPHIELHRFAALKRVEVGSRMSLRSMNLNLGMGWFGQGQNSQGTLCPRDATSKNFQSGTHRSGTDKHCTVFELSIHHTGWKP